VGRKRYVDWKANEEVRGKENGDKVAIDLEKALPLSVRTGGVSREGGTE